jgi:hypothetical protein
MVGPEVHLGMVEVEQWGRWHLNSLVAVLVLDTAVAAESAFVAGIVVVVPVVDTVAAAEVVLVEGIVVVVEDTDQMVERVAEVGLGNQGTKVVVFELLEDPNCSYPLDPLLLVVFQVQVLALVLPPFLVQVDSHSSLDCNPHLGNDAHLALRKKIKNNVC